MKLQRGTANPQNQPYCASVEICYSETVLCSDFKILK